MEYEQFEAWLKKLSESDFEYLKKHKPWFKEYEKVRGSRRLPEGFAERTMEVLEGGSESEI